MMSCSSKNQLALGFPAGSGQQLSIQFHDNADRPGHRIVGQSGSATACLLMSAQESGSGDWPASPPLQQVVRETQGESSVLLGIGQAGRSHWSASFRTDIRRPGLEIQIACRFHNPPGWLGSTYLVGDKCRVEPASDRGWIVEQASFRGLIDVAEDASISWESDQRLIRIVPRLVGDGFPATAQWSYTIWPTAS